MKLTSQASVFDGVAAGQGAVTMATALRLGAKPIPYPMAVGMGIATAMVGVDGLMGAISGRDRLRAGNAVGSAAQIVGGLGLTAPTSNPKLRFSMGAIAVMGSASKMISRYVRVEDHQVFNPVLHGAVAGGASTAVLGVAGGWASGLAGYRLAEHVGIASGGLVLGAMAGAVYGLWTLAKEA